MKKNIWKIYFLTACVLIIICSIVQRSTILLTASSLFGVIYSLLVAKNNKYALIFGIINVSTYGYILLTESIYGGFIYNIFYSLPMLAYGLYNWNKASKKNNYGIKQLNKKTKIYVTIIMTLVIFIYCVVLDNLGSSNVVLDSITSVMGYAGIYLLSNKYVEQWDVWIISNLANLIMWITLSINDIANLPVTLMWFIYFINSFYGYVSWNKKINDMKIKNDMI